MKKLLLGSVLLGTLFSSLACYSQKIKTEQIIYNFGRIPALPVKGITNYQVVIESAFETKNQQAIADYKQQKAAAEEKYRKDLAAYASLLKAANERYEKELTEYNKKSLGSKVVEKTLLDNKKPVKETVVKPYLAYVAEPRLQTSYDYKTLADTYIKLDGYQNDATNALKIVVILYGFDHTQPRTMDEQQDNLALGGSTGTRTYKSTNYFTEFSYRHPMAVKVYTPDGKEQLSITPPQLNSYKIYKSAATDQPTRINTELLIKNTEQKVLQENLNFINNLLNDRYGFSSVKRTAQLYYVKDGDKDYPDITNAFNEASSALVMLQQDPTLAKTKLQKSCDLWNNALKESNLGDKKARINKEMTIALYFNLLEGYYALNDVNGGQSTLEKLNSLSLSNTERRTKLDYDVIFSELKNRQQHN